MDIGQEINRHLAWIEAVASLFSSEGITDEKLQQISQHDQCALGQWLNSSRSEKYQSLPEFEELKQNHEAFHNMAGELVAAIKADNEAQAEATYSRFIQLSQNVVGHLKLLQEISVKSGGPGEADKAT